VHIQGTFSAHSGNDQCTFREHSGHIQGTLSAHSGNVQCLLRCSSSAALHWTPKAGPRTSPDKYSGDIQCTFRERPVHFREPLVHIQGTFSARSGNVQCTMSRSSSAARHWTPEAGPRRSPDKYSGNIQGTFRERSVHIQGTFSARSGNVQCPLRRSSSAALHWTPEAGPRGSPDKYSADIQGTFRERPVHIQGTFSAHSGNVQCTFRERPVHIEPLIIGRS
jgi:hypothetical protein